MCDRPAPQNGVGETLKFCAGREKWRRPAYTDCGSNGNYALWQSYLFDPQSVLLVGMTDRHYCFVVDFEGEVSTDPTAFGEGITRRSVVVEIGPEALTPAEGATPRAEAEAAAELARTTANEVVRDVLPTISNTAGDVTPLDELPPAVEDIEPNIDDPGVRAWLRPSAT